MGYKEISEAFQSRDQSKGFRRFQGVSVAIQEVSEVEISLGYEDIDFRSRFQGHFR